MILLVKRRWLALEKIVSNDGGFDLFVRENSSNLSVSLPLFGVRRLSDDRSTPIDNNNRNNDPYGFFNAHLNPSMTINIILFKFLTNFRWEANFLWKRWDFGDCLVIWGNDICVGLLHCKYSRLDIFPDQLYHFFAAEIMTVQIPEHWGFSRFKGI